MKCRSPNEMHDCPLFNKGIYWSMCVEVQEVREDNMDMELSLEVFDIDKANTVCSKCRWYMVNEFE